MLNTITTQTTTHNSVSQHSSVPSAYDDALQYLFSQLPMFSRIGAAAYKPGLDTSHRLDAHFGHPHRLFKSIHVAGTNGKGSVSHTLASILQSAGYKTGLYTSPHLADFRERMRINGRMIPQDDVVNFTRTWRQTPYGGHPSFFELTMAMAFKWFADNNVDIAVVETGMGGRLDSTNIITPLGCVITNISADHMQFLGHTMAAIASEKAGIIKPGIPVVVGNADGPGVRHTFQAKADAEGAPVVFAQDTPILTQADIMPDGTIKADSPLTGQFTFPLGGAYQLENLETVLHAVEMMRSRGINITDEALVNGLQNVVAQTGLAGRWMITSRNPLTICDTGHNEAGLRFTMSQLTRLHQEDTYKEGALRIVIGFVNDKDVPHILPLLPKNAVYYVTNSSVPRAMPSTQLLGLMQQAGFDCIHEPHGVTAAYNLAKAQSGATDIIFVGGSTFTVADFLAGK